MYGSKGAILGSGGVSDGYEGTKKPTRMTESNPYFAVSSSGISDGHEVVGSKRSRKLDSYLYPGVSSGGVNYYQSYSSSGSSSYGGGISSSMLQPFPVVRLRGLPFNCDDLDILKFFVGLDIVDCLLVNKNGRFSGEAFVVFSSPMQAEFALQRDRQSMGRRYIEVFRCNKHDYYQAVAVEVSPGGSFYDGDYYHNAPPRPKKICEDKDQMEHTQVLKLRGLPYSVTKSEIVEFFGQEFRLNEESVHIVCRTDGKATGEAYVEFASVEMAKKAMCKDKMTIGSRYVELFPSTHDEASRSHSRSRFDN
ncbi:hypothetical protein J5N97_021964 [Dioscorea zingiberensis]|uniref:RRM domain-containing protein n=1 Tax=Dioscorea zingiberensis TaxID=325984 RepID=A0A9D5CAK1_9LILI|nr:hypothetical protein J5N97_021964 [Dioscorea zingiberensis]